MITIEEIQVKLREAINQSPLTKSEIARRLGVSQPTISKYLHQNKYPSIDTLANLCEILDVSADDILCLKK